MVKSCFLGITYCTLCTWPDPEAVICLGKVFTQSDLNAARLTWKAQTLPLCQASPPPSAAFILTLISPILFQIHSVENSAQQHFLSDFFSFSRTSKPVQSEMILFRYYFMFRRRRWERTEAATRRRSTHRRKRWAAVRGARSNGSQSSKKIYCRATKRRTWTQARTTTVEQHQEEPEQHK